MGVTTSKSIRGREPRDLTVVADGEKFSVDKSVLALHSSVFSKMLEMGSCDNQLKIDDIDSDTMRVLIHYMYERNTENLKKSDIAVRVLVAAKRYDILELATICENKLRELIVNDNAIGVIEEAIQHKDADTLLFIIKTIVQKQLPVVKSEEMKKIYETHTDIAPIFIQHLYDNQRKMSNPIDIPGRKCAAEV